MCTEGGCEAAHLRLSHPQALLDVIPPPPQRLHLHPQPDRLQLGLLPPLLNLLQSPPHSPQPLPPLVGQVEGLVQGTLSVALDLLGPRQGRPLLGRPGEGEWTQVQEYAAVTDFVLLRRMNLVLDDPEKEACKGMCPCHQV